MEHSRVDSHFWKLGATSSGTAYRSDINAMKQRSHSTERLSGRGRSPSPGLRSRSADGIGRSPWLDSHFILWRCMRVRLIWADSPTRRFWASRTCSSASGLNLRRTFPAFRQCPEEYVLVHSRREGESFGCLPTTTTSSCKRTKSS